MKYLLLILIFFQSCLMASKEHEKIDIIIGEGQSYKYDLVKGLYKIYFTDKKPIQIDLNLTEKERKMIMEKYYELNLDALPNKITIEGNCYRSPIIYTVLTVKQRNHIQEIEIDDSCSKFGILSKAKADKIFTFINYIKTILNVRITNTPKSNIGYM